MFCFTKLNLMNPRESFTHELNKVLELAVLEHGGYEV